MKNSDERMEDFVELHQSKLSFTLYYKNIKLDSTPPLENEFVQHDF